MVYGTIYDITTGRIMMTTQFPDQSGIQLQCTLNPNYRAYIGAELNAREWYFDQNQEPTLRPSLGLSIGDGDEDGMIEVTLSPGELLTVTGIPTGTHVLHPAGEDVVDDGFIEWATDDPGEYRLFFHNHPMKEVSVHAIVG